jgi:hypothetical protein
MTFIIILMNSLLLLFNLMRSTWVEFLFVFKEKNECLKKQKRKEKEV